MDSKTRAALVDHIEEEMWDMLGLVWDVYDDDRPLPLQAFRDGKVSSVGDENSYSFDYRTFRDLAEAAAKGAANHLIADRAVPEPDGDAIERAAKAIAEMYPPRQSKHDGYVKPVWDMADIEDLAEHALKAAGSDADWLDRELDALSPDYSIYTGTGWGNTRYVAEILADDATDSHGATVIATGTGPTRKAAVLDAVAKAKGQAA